MANRFEQVDEVVGDAVTIVLSQRADGQWATVVCPKSAHESLTADRVTEPMPAKDALSGAVQLAKSAQDRHRCPGSGRRLETGMGRTLPR